MLRDLHSKGNTVVLITHDNSIAATAERIIRLADGKVIYDGPTEGAFNTEGAGRGIFLKRLRLLFLIYGTVSFAHF